MLVYKVSSNKTAEELTARICELLGCERYSRLQMEDLPNLQEVRDVDYWWHRGSYSFAAEVWCGQIQLAKRDPHPNNSFGNPAWGNLFLYLADHDSLEGGGFAVLWNHNWMSFRHDQEKFPAGWHPKPIHKMESNVDDAYPSLRYFKWQKCLHEFEEVGPLHRRQRGWHVYKCKKCGAGHTVDSGD